MAITTSNTAGNERLATLLHEFYAVGKTITDLANTMGVSNTVLTGIASEIKGNRVSTNTTHVAILVQLANT